MTEYRTKVFKSGNSLAIRLPKALGLEAGMEFDLLRDDSGAILARPKRSAGVSLSDLFGSFSPGFMAEGRGDTEQKERDWSEGSAAA
ncbi:antitoxin [Sphingomonas qomolangmaensis]|uniref:AbrB family transcriptional regulator n=1 Tax=Sphingomonas qomolangmaensis TaxID=2918765 RepID=A0ABY5LD86_9SPHN|nr:AbrB family transcriptional regulator [Sphingomonas qomolangmaensis]UUL83628.1 AbrB family transcriptional regulator [Sphingomonas qomolangmaensis]